MKNIKYFIYILVLMSLASCAQKKIVTVKKSEPVPFSFKVQKDFISPGKAKKVSFDLTGANEKLIGSFKCYDDQPYAFEIINNVLYSWISVPYLSEKKDFSCSILIDGKIHKLINFSIVKYPYAEERLKVKKSHTKLSEKNLARYRREVKRLNEVYQEAILNRSLVESDFSAPLKSKITSVYGGRRIFNDEKISWHKGVDFRAPQGTPIPVSNRGKVVFTGNLFFNGNTVIVDHGLGVLSMYCHLSKISVDEGEIIPRRQVIGLAGNTGRSTAPHLHWGMRVNGHWIDGQSLLK